VRASSRTLALGVAVAVGAAGFASDVAGGGEHNPAATRSRGEWFKSLIQPGTGGAPCCDIADCKRTNAEWRKDGWWAEVQGVWRPIPALSVLKSPRSIDGEAYVCSGDTTYSDRHSLEPRIYCFVPPDMGA
jgi:hypothetical protein